MRIPRHHCHCVRDVQPGEAMEKRSDDEQDTYHKPNSAPQARYRTIAGGQASTPPSRTYLCQQ